MKLFLIKFWKGTLSLNCFLFILFLEVILIDDCLFSKRKLLLKNAVIYFEKAVCHFQEGNFYLFLATLCIPALYIVETRLLHLCSLFETLEYCDLTFSHLLEFHPKSFNLFERASSRNSPRLWQCLPKESLRESRVGDHSICVRDLCISIWPRKKILLNIDNNSNSQDNILNRANKQHKILLHNKNKKKLLKTLNL